jgi:hypothetical protein
VPKKFLPQLSRCRKQPARLVGPELRPGELSVSAWHQALQDAGQQQGAMEEPSETLGPAAEAAERARSAVEVRA